MAGKRQKAVRQWPRVSLAIAPRLYKNIETSAAQQGVTVRAWVTEAIIRRLEDEIDAREGMAALAEEEGTVTWEELQKEYTERQNVRSEVPARPSTGSG